MQIRFQFTPTKDDYVVCQRTFGFSAWVILFALIAFIIMEFYLGNLALNHPELGFRPDWYSFFALPMIPLLFAVFILYLSPTLNRWGLEGDVAKHEELRSQVIWQIDETNIFTSTPSREIKMEWSNYSRAIEFGY